MYIKNVITNIYYWIINFNHLCGEEISLSFSKSNGLFENFGYLDYFFLSLAYLSFNQENII